MVLRKDFGFEVGFEQAEQANVITRLDQIKHNIAIIEDDILNLPSVLGILSDAEMGKLDPNNVDDAEKLYQQQLLELRNLQSMYHEAEEALKDHEENGHYSWEDATLFNLHHSSKTDLVHNPYADEITLKNLVHKRVAEGVIDDTEEARAQSLQELKDKLQGLTEGEYDAYKVFRDKHHELKVDVWDSKAEYSNELTYLALENVLDHNYDQVNHEMQQVEQELAKYDIDLTLGVVQLRPEELGNIVQNWKTMLRDQGILLPQLDTLGVEVFTEDLSEQPDFPNILIEDDTVELSDVFSLGKFTSNYSYQHGDPEFRVALSDRFESLAGQLEFFIKNQKFDLLTGTLIHELYHALQQENSKKRMETDVLEAQAHMIDRMYDRSDTIGEKWKIIGNEEVYGLKQGDQTFNEILNSLELMALGVPMFDLSSQHQQAQYLREVKRNIGLDNARLESPSNFSGKYQYKNELFDSVREVFDLEMRLEFKKALLLLLEIIYDRVDIGELEKAAFEYQKERLTEVSYFEAEDFQREGESYVHSRYFLCTSEYMDLPGKEGLIFDFHFDFEDPDDEESFEINDMEEGEKKEKKKYSELRFGYLEYDDEKEVSNISWIESDEDKEAFFKKLQVERSYISLEEKYRGVKNYNFVVYDLEVVPGYKRFLQTLISKEEAQEIVDRIFKPKVRRSLAMIVEEHGEDAPDDEYVDEIERNLGRARFYLHAYETYKELFNLN